MLAELIARQRPQLLACLVRRWGLSQLALAEDAVQQACLALLDGQVDARDGLMLSL